MNRRMILNTIMLGMFIFLFAFKLFPRPWHQIMGVAILLPVLFHVINNRRWFSALHRRSSLYGIHRLFVFRLYDHLLWQHASLQCPPDFKTPQTIC